MKNYVLGFLFSTDHNVVALIQKQRPTWQKGKLNGIGGHIEGQETPEQAMIREFQEETGVPIRNWQRFAVMSGPEWICYCFRSFSNVVSSIRSVTDEQVGIADTGSLPFNVVPNLKWLVPMALDLEPSGVHELHYNREG